jgi:hypothetical protein
MTRIYNFICIVALAAFGYEYAVLNRIMKGPSGFAFLKRTVPYFSGLDTSPLPGHQISYWLGWFGFTLMAILLSYSLRKRFMIFSRLGKLNGWLDFHIFCGLLGPILIIFHSNFKVGGLVAVSFWSMVISATSGIIGRYVYVQLLQSRGQLEGLVRFYDQGFAKLAIAQRIPAAAFEQLKARTVAAACGIHESQLGEVDFLRVLVGSIVGDFILLFRPPALLPGMHKSIGKRLREYGKLHRKIAFLDVYKRFMGYWHAFHLPFAVFMYVVAIIHIITALLFKVHA